MGELEVKRFFVFVAILCCIVFLAGCYSDEKQAAEIQDKMEESASYEESFASNQEDLNEYREKEQSTYNDLIDLDIQDEDVIQQKLDDAGTYLEKQEKLIDEAKENFQRGYVKSASIKENVKKIKDKDQKKQASDILNVMNERKKIIDTFFDDYRAQLKRFNDFYDRLEDGDFNVDDLDNQIKEINEHSQDMEDVIELFNQNTRQYSKIENDYYKKVESE